MSRPLDHPTGTPITPDRPDNRRLPLMGLWDSVVGGIAAGILVLLIWAGSLALTTFDSALIGYAVAVVALTFAIVARYSRWLRMPSTRRYWPRGWQLFASGDNFRKPARTVPARGVLPAARPGVHPSPRLVINRLAGIPYPVWSRRD